MHTINELIAVANSGEAVPDISGAAVRQARLAAGVDATMLAAAVGVCERTLRRYESGERLANQEVTRRLGRILTHLADASSGV